MSTSVGTVRAAQSAASTMTTSAIASLAAVELLDDDVLAQTEGGVFPIVIAGFSLTKGAVIAGSLGIAAFGGGVAFSLWR